jgi:Amiloride-sensitive sodium channel
MTCCVVKLVIQYSITVTLVVPNMKKVFSEQNSSLRVSVFADTTSAHGFAFFLNSSSWLSRSAWCILTLAGTVLSIVFTVLICIKYLQGPYYSTEISIEPMIPDIPYLPEIVVCDPSPWDIDKALHNNISKQLLSYITNLLYPQHDDVYKINESRYQELEHNYKTVIKNFDDNPVHLLNNITTNCSQLIDYCQLGIREKLNGTACCSRFLSRTEYTQQFKCFRTGGMTDFVVFGKAKAFGLTIGIGYTDKSTQLNDSIASLWALSMTGIGVAVTNPKSNVFHISETKMKLLAPSTYNLIGVEKTEIDNLDKSSDFHPLEEGQKMEIKYFDCFALCIWVNCKFQKMQCGQ